MRRSARAARQIEPGEGHFDAERGDVHDSAEAACRHGIKYFLNEFDRRDHIHDHPVQHRFAVEFAKVSQRRAGVIVDQDIRGGTGFEQRRLAGGGGHVGRHRYDLDACRGANLRGGLLQARAIAAVDDQRHACLGQRVCTAAAQSLTRCADDGAGPRIPKSIMPSL